MRSKNLIKSSGGVKLSLYLLMGVAAVAGAFLRFWVGTFTAGRPIGFFPYGTFAINILGSFLLGILAAWGHGRAWISPNIRLALGVGLLGSFTTFSTFSVETVTLLQQGRVAAGIAYSGGSVVLGVLGAWLGILTGRLFP